MHLFNFRQYTGDQIIKFSTDQEKNVTLLLGKNTSGKTTFVQAFRWALYEDSNFTGMASRSPLLNSDILRSLRTGDTAEAWVKITLSHRGIKYEIQRTIRYKSHISGDAQPLGEPMLDIHYYTPDGKRASVKETYKTIIDGILPEDLSEYFFFDGEKISSSRKKYNVERSINTIMGLIPLKNMIEHFETKNGVINSLLSQRKDDGSGKIEILNKQLSQHQKDLEETCDKLKTYETEVTAWQNQKDDLLKQFGAVEQFQNHAKEMQRLESMSMGFKSTIIQQENSIIKSCGELFYQMYLAFISKRTIEHLELEDCSDKGIPGMDGSSILFLLDRGSCICGKELGQNPDCKEKLKELLSFLPPESIGAQIKNLKNSIKNIQAEFKKTSEHIETTYEYYLNTIENINSNENQYKELQYECRKYNDGDVQRIIDGLDTAKSQLDAATSRRNNEKSRKRELIEAIEKSKKNLVAESASIGINKSVDDKIKYAQQILKKANGIYDTKSSENLKAMRKTLREVFNSMYHGRRHIELDDRYGVTLSIESGPSLDASKGLETVANFAFIASLLKMAKENMKCDVDGIASEPYPLVMDAVFTNTDEEHINNISSQFPVLAEQAILVLMDKDWKHAEKSLRDHVGAKYRINKKTETESFIVSEEI